MKAILAIAFLALFACVFAEDKKNDKCVDIYKTCVAAGTGGDGTAGPAGYHPTGPGRRTHDHTHRYHTHKGGRTHGPDHTHTYRPRPTGFHTHGRDHTHAGGRTHGPDHTHRPTGFHTRRPHHTHKGGRTHRPRPTFPKWWPKRPTNWVLRMKCGRKYLQCRFGHH